MPVILPEPANAAPPECIPKPGVELKELKPKSTAVENQLKTIDVNGRRYTVLKLIGCGGYSKVNVNIRESVRRDCNYFLITLCPIC